MAKRKITLLYGEGTVQVYFRLPESKRDEIEEKFWNILKEYENPTKVEIEVSDPFKSKEHPLKEKKINLGIDIKGFSQLENKTVLVVDEAEKKSNPADYISDESVVKKHNHISAIEIGKGVYDASKKESSISDEVGQFVKPKVDMDAFRNIAAGKGLKGTFALTKKKVNIDEEYKFEYVKSIPDQDDQIVIDKKGLAFYSKYDLGVFYVKWEGKYMRFDSKAEFDRFGKEYLTF